MLKKFEKASEVGNSPKGSEISFSNHSVGVGNSSEFTSSKYINLLSNKLTLNRKPFAIHRCTDLYWSFWVLLSSVNITTRPQ